MSPSSNSKQQQQQEQATEGRWTAAEQNLFYEAYSMFGRNWKKIAAVVKTRNNVQCRTHAQHLQRKNTLQLIPQRPALLTTPERTPTSTPLAQIVPTVHKTISAKPPVLATTTKPMMSIYQLQQGAILASFRHQLALQRTELSKMRPFFQQPATIAATSALYRPLRF